MAGDRAGAKAALEIARAANRHVEHYMTARKPLIEDPLEMYSPDNEDEAVYVLTNLNQAWVAHKTAALWLFDELKKNISAPAQDKSQPKRSVAKKQRVQ